MLVTLTTDEGKVGAALHGLKSAGESDLSTGIQVAQVRWLAPESGKVDCAHSTDTQLALKHRQNKNQRQRIIVFTCSPVTDSQASLVKVREAALSAHAHKLITIYTAYSSARS